MMHTLPNELIFEVGQFLPTVDLANLSISGSFANDSVRPIMAKRKRQREWELTGLQDLIITGELEGALYVTDLLFDSLELALSNDDQDTAQEKTDQIVLGYTECIICDNFTVFRKIVDYGYFTIHASAIFTVFAAQHLIFYGRTEYIQYIVNNLIFLKERKALFVFMEDLIYEEDHVIREFYMTEDEEKNTASVKAKTNIAIAAYQRLVGEEVNVEKMRARYSAEDLE